MMAIAPLIRSRVTPNVDSKVIIFLNLKYLKTGTDRAVLMAD